MQTTKQEVEKILSYLPDNCSLEDIQYHLYVLQKIEKGLKEVEGKKFHAQEEVEEKIKKWLEK